MNASNDQSAEWLVSSGPVAEALRAGDFLPGEDGPLQRWPAYRRTLLHLVLDACEPMLYVRGSTRATLYNDAALALLDGVTAKLGAPLAESWPACVDTVERTLDRTTLASTVTIRSTPQQYPEVDKLQDPTVNDMPGSNVSGCISTIARDGEGNVDGVICRIFGPHSAFAAGRNRAAEEADSDALDERTRTEQQAESGRSQTARRVDGQRSRTRVDAGRRGQCHHHDRRGRARSLGQRCCCHNLWSRARGDARTQRRYADA